MPKAVDISGRRFGRLVVVRFVEARRVGAQSKRFFECLCDCGNSTTLASGALTTGNTNSCGCLLADTITKHGAYKSAVYKVWHAMLERCRNPNNDAWKDYGGRGIKVCDTWSTFSAFRADMGPRPVGGTLERKDVNGDYTPSNCRWASPLEQANNRRNNRVLQYDGRRQTLAQWAREASIPPTTFIHRMKAGWPMSEILTRAPDKSRNGSDAKSGLLLP